MQAGTHHIGNVNKAVQDVTIRGDGCAVTCAPCCPAELVFDLAKTMPMLAGGVNGLDTITPATKIIAPDIAGKKVLPALLEPHGAQARRFRVVLLAGLPVAEADRAGRASADAQQTDGFLSGRAGGWIKSLKDRKAHPAPLLWSHIWSHIVYAKMK